MKPVIFSGIQPSGHLTIGNYIGAISQWVELQAKNQCIFSVVDYHAITVKQDPKELNKKILEVAKIYLAAGIADEQSIIFQQSAVPAHTELAWVFNCYGAHIADLNKMTQFKDKSGVVIDEAVIDYFINITAGHNGDEMQARQQVKDGLEIYNNKRLDNVSVGLYDYPVLMAADILLYDTDIVPVGEDQKQHVELARDIARRFNNQFGQIFKVPQAVVRKEGARIMSLIDPKKKMSKSDDNTNSYIALLDNIEAAKKKIMRAVTDSGSEIIYDPVNKPAIANLLTIYAQLGGRQIKRLEKDYAGKGYGEFKKDLAEVVAKFLQDFQDKYNKLTDKKVITILDNGRKQAEKIAQAKLEKVRQAIGVR